MMMKKILINKKPEKKLQNNKNKIVFDVKSEITYFLARLKNWSLIALWLILERISLTSSVLRLYFGVRMPG